MILASHQPDFMPYPGLFYKIAQCDVMDMAIYDQYSHQGYQRRVTFGENHDWVQLVVNKDTEDRKPIVDVVFHYEKSRHRVLEAIRRYYGEEPYFTVAYSLVESVFDRQLPVNGYAKLADFNVDMIVTVCKQIGIKHHHIKTAKPLKKPKADGIIELMNYYEADTYLSGNGARQYISDQFDNAGKKLVWSDYHSPTQNSIIEIIAKHKNPLSSLGFYGAV